MDGCPSEIDLAKMGTTASAILNFIEEIGALNSFPRMGWLVHGIKNAETVAEHCYRMSLLSMVLADTLIENGVELDAGKVMRLSLLHEIAEARVGDIPFSATTYITKEVKEGAERKATQMMLKSLGNLGQRYQDLWEEFEQGQTLEARLVRAADKLEMMIQVLTYEKTGFRSLDLFWENPWNQRDFDVHQIVGEIMDLLQQHRQDVIRGTR